MTCYGDCFDKKNFLSIAKTKNLYPLSDYYELVQFPRSCVELIMINNISSLEYIAYNIKRNN